MINPLIDLLTGVLGIVLILNLVALAKPHGWLRSRKVAGIAVVARGGNPLHAPTTPSTVRIARYWTGAKVKAPV